MYEWTQRCLALITCHGYVATEDLSSEAEVKYHLSCLYNPSSLTDILVGEDAVFMEIDLDRSTVQREEIQLRCLCSSNHQTCCLPDIPSFQLTT